MFIKFLILLAALGALGLFLSRAGLLGGPKRRADRLPGRDSARRDLVQCRACGIYLPAGEPCRCDDKGAA